MEVAALLSQRADLLFIPDPRRSAARRALGLIGRMTEAAVLFEPFHEGPGVDDVLACLRKVLNHRHARSLSQRDGAERSWLLCAGRPDTAIGVLRATPSDGWPRGFYDLGAALPLRPGATRPKWIVRSMRPSAFARPRSGRSTRHTSKVDSGSSSRPRRRCSSRERTRTRSRWE